MAKVKISSVPDSKEVESITESAKNVLRIESQSVAALVDRIDSAFVNVVCLFDRCEGHLVFTGIGKSGLIAGKIAATFSSIGLPSLFLHAAEASHGDMGMISESDIVVALSNSGETEEVLKLLPPLKRKNITLVSLTGNMNSTLARQSDYVLDVSVEEEACSLNLVPTASTTACLAMGDALAIALLDKRDVPEESFAKNHPGGILGRKLLTTVGDLMHTGGQLPRVDEDSHIYDAIQEMTRKRLGTTTVADSEGRLAGIITDGDLRRIMESRKDFSQKRAGDVMSRSPKSIGPDELATRAVQIMETHSITSLVVCGDGGQIAGIIHLHDILKAGIV